MNGRVELLLERPAALPPCTIAAGALGIDHGDESDRGRGMGGPARKASRYRDACRGGKEPLGGVVGQFQNDLGTSAGRGFQRFPTEAEL